MRRSTFFCSVLIRLECIGIYFPPKLVLKDVTVFCGVSDVPCPDGLVYRECNSKHDDFCYGGFEDFTPTKHYPFLFYILLILLLVCRLSEVLLFLFHLCFGCSECVIQEPPLERALQVASVPTTCLELDLIQTCVWLTVHVSTMVCKGDNEFKIHVKGNKLVHSFLYLAPTDCKGPRGEPKLVSLITSLVK